MISLTICLFLKKNLKLKMYYDLDHKSFRKLSWHTFPRDVDNHVLKCITKYTF